MKTPSHFRAGQTPEWTHEIRFNLSRERKPLLKLDVLDETKNDPTPIGATEIDCSQVFLDTANMQAGGKYILDNWYDLTCNNRQAGMIYLEMTFYPTAPVLPPKVSVAPATEQRDLPPVPESRISRTPVSIADEIFVSDDHKKKPSLFLTSDPSPPKDDGVFVTGLPKKNSRFAAFKNKFRAKEPISAIWNDKLNSGVDASITPTLSPIDDLHLRADGIVPVAPAPPPHSGRSSFSTPHSALGSFSNKITTSMSPSHNSGASSPQRAYPGTMVRPKSSDLYSTQDLYSSPDRYLPKSPELSQSQGSEQNMFPRSDYGVSAEKLPPIPVLLPDHRYSTSRFSKSPDFLSNQGEIKQASPRRKPPPDINDNFSKLQLSMPLTTSIPFSADSFGLDDDNDVLPTQVYHLGQKVQSLTHSATNRTELDPHDIDPKYYAPSPSEQMAKSWRLQNGHANDNDLKVELNTESTGYLGDGKWQTNRFSPSVFLRVNDENHEKENKPAVPPKIPQGLSEREYFVLEKDNYLKDMNGRRI